MEWSGKLPICKLPKHKLPTRLRMVKNRMYSAQSGQQKGISPLLNNGIVDGVEWRTYNLQTSKSQTSNLQTSAQLCRSGVEWSGVEWRTSNLQTSNAQTSRLPLNFAGVEWSGLEWSGELPICKFPKHKSHSLDALRLSQHVHSVNITSVRLLIAPFGHVTTFTTCPPCQYYQCSSLNHTL